MQIKTVSVIGLGALGILYANQLSKHLPKENVRIIADQGRIEKYIKDGVYCNGELCDFHYVTPQELIGPSDLVLFAVKFGGLQDAIEAVKNQVGGHTILLSALNGITSEKIIADTYGEDNVLYCVAQGMDAVKTDNRLTYKNMGFLCFGDKEPGVISQNTRAVSEFFTAAKIPHEVLKDSQTRLWSKFMLNVGVNQTAAVYQTNYGGLQREGEARNTMLAAMREVMVLSRKEGINLTETDIEYWMKILHSLNPEGTPSMRQDTDAKRISEVELFSGTVLDYGKKHLIQTPVNQMLYEKIKGMESRY